jgi:glucose/mannose transport system substrate-binding protein
VKRSKLDVNASRILSRGLLILCAAFAGCGDQSPADARHPKAQGTVSSEVRGEASERQLVELFSWWTAPGEAEALQALIEAHKRAHPSSRMFNAVASSGGRTKPLLEERLAHDDPPDLIQQNAHDLRAFVQTHPGKLEPIDSLADELGLRKVAFSEVLSDVTIGGHIYAMPVNVHRENSLFYNRALFQSHGLKPPRSLEELLNVCEKLKSAGITPIATSHQGWILRIMFHSILMGRMGGEHYRELFAGRVKAEDPALRDAISIFDDILHKYTNPDASEEGFGWTNAAQAIFNGDAAMFFHGDWVKGYLIQLGWKPGADFGVVGAPGASEVFLYGVDVFSLPRGAQNEPGAREFLATVASREGQLRFNELKGSSPIRIDIEKQDLDAVSRDTLEDLERAKVRMLVPSLPNWDDALGAFAKDGDEEALFKALTAALPHPAG